MREIKFRVWDKVNYMSVPFNLTDLQHKIIQFTSDCPVMQYTGLKDKNGKEIYEGDILRSWYSRDTTGKDIIYMIFPVEYETLDYKGFSGFQIEFLKNASIIGTIYENPELLNSEITGSND